MTILSDHHFSESLKDDPGVGSSILLGSGHYFNYERPEESHWTLWDIARALGGEQRWSGQSSEYFYVAQHCVLMARQAEKAGDKDLVFPILNHENGEAFCGDMSSTLKILCPEYRANEKRIASVINQRMGVPELTEAQQKKLKEYDLRMMATERLQLMTNWQGEHWEILDGVEPFEDLVIEPQEPKLAAIFWAGAWAGEKGMLVDQAARLVF